MLRPDLADNTYGLAVLSVVGCAILAHLFIGKLRYGAFMGSTAFLVRPTQPHASEILELLQHICQHALLLLMQPCLRSAPGIKLLRCRP